MPETKQAIDGRTDVRPTTSAYLRQLQGSGHPTVLLLINGEAELVVRDAASYQTLIDLAERAERMEALRESVEDMRAGRVAPLEDMLSEMRRILDEKPSL